MTAQVRLLQLCTLMVKELNKEHPKVEMVERNPMEMVWGVVLKERVVLVEKVVVMEEMEEMDLIQMMVKEEEEEENDPPVHPELPPTPEGSYSSSEPAWIERGYSTDGILQKKHHKEVTRATAKSARLLDQTQDKIPQHLSISHMEATIAAQEEAAIQAEKTMADLEEYAKEAEKQKKKEDAAAQSHQRIQDEIQRRKKVEEQELRKQELLASIEKAKAAEKKAAEDIKEMHRQLEMAEQKAEDQAAAEAAAKEVQPDEPAAPGLQVKEEILEDVELELKELSSLRLCKLCNCQLLAEEYKDSLEEYKDELQEPMAPRVDLPMPPLSHEPIIVEDLETQEEWKHGQDQQQPAEFSSLSKEYQESVISATKKKRSKGIKRVLALHAAIESKRARGEWYGPPEPCEMSSSQKTWLDSGVQKAIESAPLRATKR
eukprot:s3841_g7.t1